MDYFNICFPLQRIFILSLVALGLLIGENLCGSGKLRASRAMLNQVWLRYRFYGLIEQSATTWTR